MAMTDPNDRSTELHPSGVFFETLTGPDGREAPGLFLDRDGVLIEDRDYVGDPEDVHLVPGVAGVLTAFRNAGWRTVVITNQSGIGRGYFGWDAFRAVNDRMIALLADEGATIDAGLACPFHPDATGPYRAPDHPMRKPNPGMLLLAAEALAIDLSRSVVVGDRFRDIEAGRRAGLRRGYLALTGYGREYQDACRDAASAAFPIDVIDSLAHLDISEATGRR